MHRGDSSQALILPPFIPHGGARLQIQNVGIHHQEHLHATKQPGIYLLNVNY